MAESSLNQQCINTLRLLSVDMVQHANSGHPGLPLGAAPMAYVLWTKQLKHHPANPQWADRDRFVLSAGHGSALLYSLLHLTGYALTLDDLKRFRQCGSNTPGHPEYGHTPGVEITTGPLGQGLANAVGMAIGEAHLAARYNRDDHTVIDHRTWAIVSDGDLMEGVACEAVSLAGHLKLGKLVCLYDDNRVTLAAGTDITFSEDRGKRFEACGWQTLTVAGGRVTNAIAPKLPALFGGSADLDTSTHTNLKGMGNFNPPATPEQDTQGSDAGGWSYAGRNLHFGVREHAMGAIVNGLAVHGGFVAYGSTFLIFSDYMRPSIRLASLMGLHVVHVFTHDSIALGEDGPTHQPVEQLAALRAIPHCTVIRPADANESAVAWRVAIETRDRPVLLVLSRQDLPTLDRARYASADGLRQGAYVVRDALMPPVLILIASGSELNLIVDAAERLHAQGIAVRCVSMPSWELFEVQPQSYRDGVLALDVPVRLAVEAGIAQGWHRYVGDAGAVLSVEGFGASAPAAVLLRECGFTVNAGCERAQGLLARGRALVQGRAASCPRISPFGLLAVCRLTYHLPVTNSSICDTANFVDPLIGLVRFPLTVTATSAFSPASAGPWKCVAVSGSPNPE